MAQSMRRSKASGNGSPLPSGKSRVTGRLRGMVALPAALFALGLLAPLPGLAAPLPDPAARVNVAMLEPSKEELLLFWEEKELYVETATRIEKPITQVAENITVISAREIEEMNAHSLAEVLNRVPGLFVDFQGQDFVSPSLLKIQGSKEWHVTVLLDGVVWNFLVSGSAETSGIPLRIIERIEIVKGPASSAWGSALGGVVNIITKGAGKSAIPKGQISGSYGEADSHDVGAELYGKGGPLGYYLFAGRQKSDGLRDNRGFEQDRLYAKLNLAPSRDLELFFTAGYSDPSINGGDNPLRSADSRTGLTTFFAAGSLEYRITPELSLKGAVHSLRHRFNAPVTDKSSGQLLVEPSFDEQSVGGNFRLLYTGDMHTAVVGADFSLGSIDSTVRAAAKYAAIGQPPSVTTTPELDRWAVFANDTVELGRLAVTPGIRFDKNSISGDFVSPSIGATYELGEHSVARATVARGFTSPSLGKTTTGGFRLDPNPSLGAEYGWSYQAGLESGVTDYLNLKSTLFRHDTTNELVAITLPNKRQMVVNKGDVTRQGYDLEAETVPFHNVSLRAGHAYVHTSADSAAKGQDNYSWLVGVRYDDRRSLMAQLSGYYIWWNLPAANGAKYNTFIWDLNLNKRFRTSDRLTTEVFLSVHNLFGGAYYTVSSQPNPGRWAEGGLRFRF